MPLTNFPNGLMATPLIGSLLDTFNGGVATSNVFFVDGDLGNDTYDGQTPLSAKKTIQAAINVAAAGASIYIKARKITAGSTDPVDYAETLIIPVTLPGLKLIGVGAGPAQGALPQIKPGSGSVAVITVRAPGCLIARLGINGNGATGGGILLDDNGSTKTAFGTIIMECHLKNCRGSSATNGNLGGAIMWASTGSAWQVRIVRNKFYKNLADVVLLGTSIDVPQDVVIEDNIFSGPAASVDVNLQLGLGSGMNGVYIRRNTFPCFPAIGSGTNAKPLVLTGCVGILADNSFGCSAKTFGAAGNVLVPTTVLMANNYQEPAAGASGEIGRT